MTDQNDYFSVKEFANKLHVHPNTIYRAIKKGKLYAIQLGTTYRINESELYRMPLVYLKSLNKCETNEEVR